MKRSLTLAISVTLVYFITAFTALSFAADKGATGPAANSLLREPCKEAPSAQVVNNSTLPIYQVKVGKTLFSRNLSRCSDGCSTGFKDVSKGRNTVQVKMTEKSAWITIGTLQTFSNCKHYAVNIRKNGNSICAELYLRPNTDPTFNADKTKKKIMSVCKRISPAASISRVPEKPTAANAQAPASRTAPEASASGRFAGQSRPAEPVNSVMRVSAPRPEITYIRFKRPVNNTGTFAAPALAPGASASSDRPVTVRADFGDSVTLACGFNTKNTRRVTAKLIYSNGSHSNLQPGSGREMRDGTMRYDFTTNVIARQSETLTLEIMAYANGPGGIARERKTLEMDVKSPVLQARRPDFDNDSRELTFRVRNRGNMAFPDAHGVRLEYRVAGMPGNREIVSNTRYIRTTINRGATVNLDTITLPESALAYPRLKVDVTIGGQCGEAQLPRDDRSDRFEWETKTMTINEGLLDIFSSLFDGNVRLNTFERGHGNSSKHQPYDGDDSRIDLTVTSPDGPRTVFDQAIPIPSFKFGTDGFEAVVFINELNAEIGGPGMFFIRNGKLGLRIEFDCSRSREIEVWARDAIAKRWVDSWLPDLDLRSFSIEFLLTPDLVGQTLTYSALDMNANVNLDMPGHRVERWLERTAAREIERGFAPIFDNASTKQAIEDAFAQLLESPLFNIRHLVEVRPSGSTINIIYR